MDYFHLYVVFVVDFIAFLRFSSPFSFFHFIIHHHFAPHYWCARRREPLRMTLMPLLSFSFWCAIIDTTLRRRWWRYFSRGDTAAYTMPITAMRRASAPPRRATPLHIIDIATSSIYAAVDAFSPLIRYDWYATRAIFASRRAAMRARAPPVCLMISTPLSLMLFAAPRATPYAPLLKPCIIMNYNGILWILLNL